MFPNEFYWGAATSSHQVEGANTLNDWWDWEKQGGAKDSSGEACRSYTLYEQDFDLAKSLGHNSHRLSLEWSRIEPSDGHVNHEELRHYKKVIKALKDRGLEPIVTLHHFTIPRWFSHMGGWHYHRASEYFLRYVDFILDAFKDDVKFWITINEPMVYAYQGYWLGVWPPGEKDFKKARQVANNMAVGHRLAYDKIHEIYRSRSKIKPMVGIAKHVRPFYVCPKTDNLPLRLGVYLRHKLYNSRFLEKISRKMDFVGVNYYEGEFNSNDAAIKMPLWGGNCTQAHGHITHANQLGWNFDPEGLLEALRFLKKFKKPIMITENGTCELDDSWRIRFLDAHLKMVEKAIQEKINVIGYLHWSLLDNFEWAHGFGPRFGLIQVDFKTYERRIKPSAHRLAKIIQEKRVS